MQENLFAHPKHEAMHIHATRTFHLTEKQRSLLAVLWFAAVACAVFWRVVFQSQMLFYGDIMLYFQPALTFARQWLLQGVLPLWNPHILFGQPYVGNPQEWLLYPSAWLLLMLDAARVISWGAVIHLWLAGIGLWLFVRRRGHSCQSAVAAGTLWMLCGSVVLRTQHVSMLQSIAWFGWLLWALEGLLQRANLRSAFGLALVLAFASLAGHPQVLQMQMLLLLAWTIWRWRQLPHRASVVGWGMTAVVIATQAGGAHWLPFVELLRHTERVRLPIESLHIYSLHPAYIPLLFLPDLYGFPWRGDYALNVFYWELSAFVGTIPLVAALAGLRGAERELRFWVVVALVCLWLAMGTYGGLYTLVYWLLPGAQSIRTPVRWLLVVDLALCIWAALVWGRVHLNRRWWLLPLSMLVVVLMWHAFGEGVSYGVARRMPEASAVSAATLEVRAQQAFEVVLVALWRVCGVSALAVAVLMLRGRFRWVLGAAVTLAELLWIAIPANPTCSPEVFLHTPQAVQALQERGERLFVPDTAPIWLHYVNARDYGRADASVLTAFRETLCSNIVMTHGADEASGYEPVPIQASLRMVQQVAQGDNSTLSELGIGAVAIGRSAKDWRVVVLQERGARAWMLKDRTPVVIQVHTPQRLAMQPPKSGELILTDSAYPGWKAFVDGKQKPWQVHEGAFRRITVPAGAERVEWRYQPDTFLVGLYLTCLGWAILAGTGVYLLRRR